jgi:hypothetical protein
LQVQGPLQVQVQVQVQGQRQRQRLLKTWSIQPLPYTKRLQMNTCFCVRNLECV